MITIHLIYLLQRCQTVFFWLGLFQKFFMMLERQYKNSRELYESRLKPHRGLRMNEMRRNGAAATTRDGIKKNNTLLCRLQ